ncbi:MAG TPA: hypothetical protein VFE60_20135, partial [Roseiarcus sp.]|nr:hypothetical protein [Roseiarcus sp.]
AGASPPATAGAAAAMASRRRRVGFISVILIEPSANQGIRQSKLSGKRAAQASGCASDGMRRAAGGRGDMARRDHITVFERYQGDPPGAPSHPQLEGL